MSKLLNTCLLALALWGGSALAQNPAAPKANKLMAMYQLFYLPFPLDFKVGRTVDTVLPYVADKSGKAERLVEASELVELDRDWDGIREEWRKKSLLEFNVVPLGQSQRISPKLVSHKVPVTHQASDTIPVAERRELSEMLKGKPASVIASYYQLRLIKSLASESDLKKFNFVLISASWCESSREYRTLLESYFKKFPNPELVLHSVVVEDPKQTVFESRLLKELFPEPKRHTHDTIPRFLAFEMVEGKPKVYEEAEALIQLYERFYAQHRGFLADKTKALGAKKPSGASKALSPALSSASK